MHLRQRLSRLVATIVVAGLSLGGVSMLAVARGQDAAAPETPSGLLQKGIDTEKTSLVEACPIYLRLIEKFPKDELVPRANLRLGICLQKLGRTEEARGRMRQARMLGKDDPVLCHEAEQALMGLPPEPPKPAETTKPADSPKENKPAGDHNTAPVTSPQNPQAKPAPQKSTAPAPQPANDERSLLVKQIEDLDAQRKAKIDKVHELEDAGKTTDAYKLRAEADAISKQIDEVKTKIRALGQRPKPQPQKPAQPAPSPAAKPDSGAPQPKPASTELDEAGKQRLMLALQKDKLESDAKLAEGRAEQLKKDGKNDEANAALAEAKKARAELAKVQEKLNALPATVSADPSAQKEAELTAALDKARAALKDAEAKNDNGAKETARAEVRKREKELRELREAREAAAEKARLDRVAEAMRKRGAPQWEADERLALVQKEIDLEHSYREKARALRKDDKGEKKDELKQKLAELEKQKRDQIEKLRADTEERILARAKVELEKELDKKAAELKAQNLPQKEIDQKLADYRKELEAKYPGRKPEKKAAEGGAKETIGSAPVNADHDQTAEIAKLKKRIDDLERENAALKGQLAKTADGTQATVPPGASK